jgi:hypothetical protein
MRHRSRSIDTGTGGILDHRQASKVKPSLGLLLVVLFRHGDESVASGAAVFLPPSEA